MKLNHQIQHVLFSSVYRSEADWKIVRDFCLARHCRVGTFTPEFSSTGITAPQFIEWCMNGHGPGDFALQDGKVVLIGECTVDKVNVIGELTGDECNKTDYLTDHCNLSKLGPDLQKTYARKLSLQGLEYSRKKHQILPKYTPKVNERIYLYNNELECIGVIRDINVDCDEIELYCYYSYTSQTVGYSMHERNICNYHDFHFEPMDIVASRRLNSELNKHGMTWYDRLHRVEPTEYRVKKGEKYWYIDDKMRIVQAIEKETLTSDFRYRAGNYFIDFDQALDCLGKISDILRDRLAQ